MQSISRPPEQVAQDRSHALQFVFPITS